MNDMTARTDPMEAHALLGKRAQDMKQSLTASYLAALSPSNEKTLRLFTAGEAARYLGISTSFLRTAHAREQIPDVHESRGGHRVYSAQAIDQIRDALEGQAKTPGTYRKGRRGDDHLAVITLSTFKGGAGKSTAALHIGQGLALKGYRVLTVDMDPQGSLTSYFGLRPEIDLRDELTIYDAIRYEDPVSLSECVRDTFFHNLKLAPADLQLHTFEHETPLWLLQQQKLPMEERSPYGFYERLSIALSDVDQDFDVVLLDCPPSLGFITLTAMCAATGMLITVVPSMLDVESLSSFMEMSSELLSEIASAGLPMSWDFQKFLLSRFEPTDGPQVQLASYLRNLFVDDVMQSTFLKSTAIGDSGLTRQGLWEIDRSEMNRQTYDRAMDAIWSVTEEVEELLMEGWGRH